MSGTEFLRFLVVGTIAAVFAAVIVNWLALDPRDWLANFLVALPIFTAAVLAASYVRKRPRP